MENIASEADFYRSTFGKKIAYKAEGGGLWGNIHLRQFSSVV